MTIDALGLPVDIPWRRLAYSADLVDRDFLRSGLPPMWRSSVTVFSHVVPLEESQDRYPDTRVVYLRVSTTITGWTPSEDLAGVIPVEDVGDTPGDWQTTVWEAIAAAGWAEKYWPCVGAILQVAVYARGIENGTLDDVPYFADFEPKKRELYETVTSTGEMLSGSSDRVALQKGMSNAETTEKSSMSKLGGGIGGSLPLPGDIDVNIGLGGGHEWGTKRSTTDETFENRITDTSRERRETQSHTTTLNQMYQLFTAYHLGVNRAVFVMFPRPHIVQSAEQAEVNVIAGERKLEGIQDVLLVVHLPARATGLCVQVNLDTGHKVEFGPGHGTDDLFESRPLLVTRRITRACAEIGEDGRLHPVATPSHPADDLPIVGDLVLDSPDRMRRKTAAQIAVGGRADRAALANDLNALQTTVRERMLSSSSSRRYKPRRFVDTATFRTLVGRTLRRVPLDLDELRRAGVLAEREVESLGAIGVRKVSDLFDDDAVEKRKGKQVERIHAAQAKVAEALFATMKPPGRATAR